MHQGQHNCQPLWIAGRGPVATCGEHWDQQVGPTPAPARVGRTR